MELYSQNGFRRPIRLSESTRRFANDSLLHKYGLDTRRTNAIALDGVRNIETLSRIELYNVAISRIAAEAPIRICEGERVSGAATLGLAIDHSVPATVGGAPICRSISHLTIDFETVLRRGMKYIRERASLACARHAGSEREPFARSCVACLDAFDVWHRRYLEALASRPEYAENYRNLSRVPHEPASNFYEAVQSLWFVFAFVRLCGNWPGIGRIDALLGDYLERDLEEGRITEDEAREILAHFFIKGCEWICGGDYDSGDAQHYQNIVLAGVDSTGREVTNRVTYLVLDILEELGISDFPTTVRIGKNTPDALIRRVAEVMRFGGGVLAVYNEDLIIDSLTAAGYPVTEARKFANDGCWEVQIPGKTFFIYSPFDSLQLLQKKTLGGYTGEVDYPDFEALYLQYSVDLRAQVEEIFRDKARVFISSDSRSKDWKWKPLTPCTVVSLFEEGCIEKGLSYLEGGPIYNLNSPHIGGLADTVNSLYAIKKLVYDEKRLTLREFVRILAADWENSEELRQYVLNTYSYYGNDNDEVDLIAVRLLDDFADACDSLNSRCGYDFPAGVSTFGRQLGWASTRAASPHGRKKGEVLAANASATPGTDREGATSLIRSYCKANLARMTSGSALDVKILPGMAKGERGLDMLVSLMKGFVTLGGFFMQLDVVDASLLREAQEHPENYQTLSVRVSGWNARFVTLSKGWQDMIIAQNEY